MNQRAVQFVKDFIEEGKPVAAICEGQLILGTGEVRGRMMTSRPFRTDLKNAGVDRLDNDVVCDEKLVTSGNPDDIPAFDREMIRLFAEEREHTQDMRKFY